MTNELQLLISRLHAEANSLRADNTDRTGILAVIDSSRATMKDQLANELELILIHEEQRQLA